MSKFWEKPFHLLQRPCPFLARGRVFVVVGQFKQAKRTLTWLSAKEANSLGIILSLVSGKLVQLRSQEGPKQINIFFITGCSGQFARILTVPKLMTGQNPPLVSMFGMLVSVGLKHACDFMEDKYLWVFSFSLAKPHGFDISMSSVYLLRTHASYDLEVQLSPACYQFSIGLVHMGLCPILLNPSSRRCD